MQVGFVGLGTMGAPMAGHLLRTGAPLTVFNRTAAKAEPLRALGAKVADSLVDLGAACDVIFLCVGRTEDVQACVEQLAVGARPETLIVDHSTIAPQPAEQLHARLATARIRFVDAPVTGGSMGAQRGQLTIFCGGETRDIEQAAQYMKAYAKSIAQVGGPGAGQMMKMANQIAVGGALIGLCESLAFAKKAGLDLRQTRDLLATGAAGSWAFENYGPKILAEDWTPGFAVEHQRKDFAYCRDTASEIDAAIPMTQLVDRLLEKLERAGHGDWTTAALYETMVKMGFDD